jgi:hypothetical protein
LVSVTFRKLSPVEIVALVREAGLAGIEWALATACELGAPTIRLWPGTKGSVEVDDAARRSVVADFGGAASTGRRGGALVGVFSPSAS